MSDRGYDIAEDYPPTKKRVGNLIGYLERDEETGLLWYGTASDEDENEDL